MRTLLAIGVFASSASLLTTSSSPASSGLPQRFRIEPIHAVFVPTLFETVYDVSYYFDGPKAPVVKVTWNIRLELVDKAGAPDPSTPGSSAAVDLGCTNAGSGVPNPVEGTGHPAVPHASYFAWVHPDAADSRPPGRYHCDHMEMGPHGHQGLITVVATGKSWKCTATYKGTNSNFDVEQSVKDGTATEPKCSKLG